MDHRSPSPEPHAAPWSRRSKEEATLPKRPGSQRPEWIREFIPQLEINQGPSHQERPQDSGRPPSCETGSQSSHLWMHQAGGYTGSKHRHQGVCMCICVHVCVYAYKNLQGISVYCQMGFPCRHWYDSVFLPKRAAP